MKKKIAIQMDDIKSIDFDFDSSFIIGLEGQRRNYDLFYYHPDDLFIDAMKYLKHSWEWDGYLKYPAIQEDMFSL